MKTFEKYISLFFGGLIFTFYLICAPAGTLHGMVDVKHSDLHIPSATWPAQSFKEAAHKGSFAILKNIAEKFFPAIKK